MQTKIRRCSLLLVLTAVSVWSGWHLLRDERVPLTKIDFPTSPWVNTTAGAETTGLHGLSDHQPQPGDADHLNSPYVTMIVSGDPDRWMEVDGRELPATGSWSPAGKWLRLSEAAEVARLVDRSENLGAARGQLDFAEVARLVDRSENRRLTADEVNQWQMRDYQERAERRLSSGPPYRVRFHRPLIGIQNQDEGR